MNAAFFGKKEPKLRPMKRSDITQVVSIINEHDEDDAEEAGACLHESQEGMFVLDDGSMFSLEESGGVFGVIGARSEPDVDDIVWLSWTYVAQNRKGEGWGKMMMEELINMLRQNGIRKMFIATSDYREDGEEIYADAKELYTSFGAELELNVPKFHDDDEAQQIYGLKLLDQPEETPEIETLDGTLEFYDVNPVPESEDGYALNWRLHEEPQDLPNTLDQLKRYTEEGQQHNARMLIATLPSDLSNNVTNDFHTMGFEKIGHLKDYHAIGLNQDYWAKYF